MFHTGKCPKCDALVSKVKIEHVDIMENLTSKWHGVSLVCQYCGCVLGVSIDPVALKNDVVAAVQKLLKGR